MKNALRQFMLAILVAAIGFSMISCPGGNGGGDEIPATLYGVWVSGSGSDQEELTIYSNGSYELKVGNILSFKGTYAGNNASISFSITHVHGDILAAKNPRESFVSKWYSRNDLKQLNPTNTDAVLDGVFTSYTATYSVTSTSLILTDSEGSTAYTKKGGGDNGNDVTSDIYVVDISKESSWDFMVVGKDGSSVLFCTDENAKPTHLFFKPDKDSDNGVSFLFKENGFPDKMIVGGYIVYYGNFHGYQYDMAVIKPDGTTEYHRDIETEVNWEAYNGMSPVYDIRARNAVGIVNESLDWISIGVTLGTCVAAFYVPPLIGQCVSGGANIVIGAIANYVLDDLGSAVHSTIVDILGCVTALKKFNFWVALDCVNAIIDVITLLFDDDIGYFNGNKDKVNEAAQNIEDRLRSNQTPYESDYTVSGLYQEAGSVKAVVINGGKSPGSVRNIYYGNSMTIPQRAGTYYVTFDVGEAPGWNAVVGLYAGELTVYPAPNTPVADDYIFGEVNQTEGDVWPITITPKSGKSTGRVSSISYFVNGSRTSTIPQTAGTYIVFFSVEPSPGWNEAADLRTSLTVNPVENVNGNLSAGWFEDLGHYEGYNYVVTGYRVVRNGSEIPPDNIVIPATWNGKPVTEIGKFSTTGVFQNHTNITSVNIPSSVTMISSNAFYGCTGLTRVVIPNSVTIIGTLAFYNCTSLADINIGSGLRSIGGSVFQNTPWLDSQPDGEVYAGRVLYTYKGTMPPDTTISLRLDTIGIADNAFDGRSNLTSITIPNGVTVIGTFAFRNTKNLTSLIIPDSVNTLEMGAFAAAENLTSLSIGSGVREMGMMVFANCENLTNVTISNGVTIIGATMFSGCTKLPSITLPSSITTIGGDAFNECYYLASVTFQSTIDEEKFSDQKPFLGDLRDKYLAGGPGTYTTTPPPTGYFDKSKWNPTWAKR